MRGGYKERIQQTLASEEFDSVTSEHRESLKQRFSLPFLIVYVIGQVHSYSALLV